MARRSVHAPEGPPGIDFGALVLALLTPEDQSQLLHERERGKPLPQLADRDFLRMPARLADRAGRWPSGLGLDEAYLWASWRVPVFYPDPEHEGETWCEDRLPMSPPPTHWLPLSPPDDGRARPDDWTVTAYCWRLGPVGSIACYTLGQRKAWTRCYEHEGSATISDEKAEAIALNIVEQFACELYPKLLYSIRSAQGDDPDRRAHDQRPDA